jgi:phosphatidate cytidylyltransferase
LARGPQIVLWLVLLVIAADVGAYFAGRSLGRRKLAPRVSPGKTLEGALGGLLLVALVAWAGAAHFGLPPLGGVIFGCAVGIFSVIGDLTESMFKRAAGLKDSGVLLPGHGGLLDRIDSVTAAAPLYALGLFGAGVIA